LQTGTGISGNISFWFLERFMGEFKRAFFRLEYPQSTAPKFVCAGVNYQVKDISERGLKLGFASPVNFRVNSTLMGVLDFGGGESVWVLGKVRRVTEKSLGVELINPIPLRIIMAEQRRMIQYLKMRA
jgi:PilZ domain